MPLPSTTRVRRQDRDVLGRGDFVDQVGRHGLGERVGAYDEGHFAGQLGEVQRRLAGGVAGANEVDARPLDRLASAGEAP